MNADNASPFPSPQGPANRSAARNESSLEHRWGWFALRGVLALIFGVVALLMPLAAVLAMTLVFGAYALVDGIFSLIAGIRRADTPAERWGPLVLRGVLGIFAGVVVVIMPLAATVALVAFTWGMVALWALATGVMEVAAAVRLRREIKGEWLLGLSGVLGILLGVAVPVLLVLYPAAGLLALGIMIGVYAIATGVVQLVLAYRLRKRQRDEHAPPASVRRAAA